MEDFTGARGVVAFFKVLVIIGLVMSVLAIFIGIEAYGVAGSAIRVLPFMGALAVQYLLCEVARAVFAVADATQGARQDASKAFEIDRKENVAYREGVLGLLAARDMPVTEDPPASTASAPRAAPAGKVADVSPAPPDRHSFLDPQVLVEHYKGVRISKNSKGYISAGGKNFVDVQAARVAIDRGDIA